MREDDAGFPRYLQTAIAVAKVAKDEAEKFVRGQVGGGALSKGQVEGRLEELVSRGKAVSDTLSAMLPDRLRRSGAEVAQSLAALARDVAALLDRCAQGESDPGAGRSDPDASRDARTSQGSEPSSGGTTS